MCGVQPSCNHLVCSGVRCATVRVTVMSAFVQEFGCVFDTLQPSVKMCQDVASFFASVVAGAFVRRFRVCVFVKLVLRIDVWTRRPEMEQRAWHPAASLPRVIVQRSSNFFSDF